MSPKGWASPPINYLLLGVILFLADPTLKPRLKSVGLDWLWLLGIAAAVAWGFLQMARLRRAQKKDSEIGQSSKS